MVKISSSMAAGVLFSMFLCRCLPAGPEPLHLCCLVAFCASTGCSIALGVARRPVTAAMPAFFFAGMFCFLSRSITGPCSGPLVLRSALESFSSGIDAAGYSGEQTAALLKALLCGDRSCLAKDSINAFRTSGASHLLALSGLHLGVIYMVAGKLLFFLGNSTPGRTIRSVSVVSLCGFYTMMTGASPSIVRAFLFILLKEILWLCPGRTSGTAGIYCTALTIQLALDPLEISSPGFQLSYMAMAGIYTVYPILEGWYPELPSNRGREAADRGPRVKLAFASIMKKIWNAAALSVSCQLFTAPLAWLYFKSFPPYFLIANLISLPVCEGLIVSGLASLAIPFLVPVTDFLADTLIRCTEIISGL